MDLEYIPQEEKQKRLQLYLQCESLLNRFFHQVDLCSHCYKGVFGCCTVDNYDKKGSLTDEEISLLVEKRLAKYGLPPKKEFWQEGLKISPCRYHTSDGCLLKDHKPPLCLSYVCGERIIYLKENFQIDYECVNVKKILESVLAGSIEQEELKEFRLKIEEFIDKVNQKGL